MSRRYSYHSETSSNATGEHSKVYLSDMFSLLNPNFCHFQSRESWDAIHQGSVPSHVEDANFCEWQKWHHYLEKNEVKRRRKRTMDFLQESNRSADLYLDEIYARRAIEVYVRYGFRMPEHFA